MNSPSTAPTNATTAHTNQETHQQHQRPQHQALPKENSPRTPEGAPPPYTPPARQLHSNVHHIMAMASNSLPFPAMQHAILRQQQQQPNFQATQRSVITHVLSDAADEACGSEEEIDAPLFPLTMRINTAVSVSKNDNIVCLTDSPTKHASVIAAAVTKAIEQTSSGSSGIPMVDGDGNPRPIKIEVDAGTVIDGARNLVGTETAVLNILRQRESMRKQQQQHQESHGRRRRLSDEGYEDGSGVSDGLEDSPNKRRRSS